MSHDRLFGSRAIATVACRRIRPGRESRQPAHHRKIFILSSRGPAIHVLPAEPKFRHAREGFPNTKLAFPTNSSATHQQPRAPAGRRASIDAAHPNGAHRSRKWRRRQIIQRTQIVRCGLRPEVPEDRADRRGDALTNALCIFLFFAQCAHKKRTLQVARSSRSCGSTSSKSKNTAAERSVQRGKPFPVSQADPM